MGLVALEGLTRGQDLQEQLPGCSYCLWVAHLQLCLGETRKVWVELDSRMEPRIHPGSLGSPGPLRAAIIIRSTHLAPLLFKHFLYIWDGEGTGLRARPGG